MVLAILLAQLWLGPSASPDLNRAGAGEIVCDFTSGSPVCSDGTAVNTQVAGERPCEYKTGQGFAGVNQACLGVNGLESWTSTTNYLGGDPNNPATWTANGDFVVASLPGEVGLRASKNGVSGGGVSTPTGDRVSFPSGTTLLLAFDVRGVAGYTAVRAGPLGAGCTQPSAGSVGAAWEAHTRTCTLSAADSAVGVRFDLPSASEGVFDVRNARLVTGTSPGRPCWARDGSKGFVCHPERHQISNTVFPVEDGVLTIVFSANDQGVNNIIVDGRSSSFIGPMLYYASGTLRWYIDGASVISGPTFTPGVHVVALERKGGTTTLRYDGVVVGTTTLAWNWPSPVVTLGSSNLAIGSSALNGGISYMRISK